MDKLIKNAIEEFNNYTKQFDMENEMISRKYYHTFRVADYALEIAKSENLNEQDTYIAYLCGLLHDIARFKIVERKLEILKENLYEEVIEIINNALKSE